MSNFNLNFSIKTFDELISKDDIISKMFPENIWVFVAQFLAFVVMIVLVTVFAYKPIKKALNKRKEYVNQNLKDAEKAKLEAADLKIEANKNVALSKKEANKILQNVNIEADKLKLLKEEELNKEFLQKREEFNKELQIEKQKMIEDQKAEVISLAFEVSNKILEKNIDKKDNEKLIDEFVKEIENE